MLDECTEGIVLQQSNLIDSTVTLHLHLVVRNKRWNSLQVEVLICHTVTVFTKHVYVHEYTHLIVM